MNPLYIEKPVVDHISALSYNIFQANTGFGKLLLDECFRRTKSCFTDDNQYCFPDPQEFPIVEDILRKYGFIYSFDVAKAKQEHQKECVMNL